ncbi:MAG: stage II sporulation protein D [Bacilli bacterium]|nr:stage II sporulation protein D [Bacilli bacterium]
MIYDYDIVEINNEDNLVLYISLDNEFAKLKSKVKKNKLKEIVDNFIKDNNIKFKGNKIKIVLGGFLLGTLLLAGKDLKLNETNSNIIPNNSYSLVWSDDLYLTTYEEQPLEVVEELNEEVVVENNQDDIVVKNNKTYELPKKSIIVNENNDTEQSIEVNEVKENETIENNTYVTIKRKNGTILNLELEEYLIGVVGAEMPASFNIEALKSQAIIARTYTLKALERNKTLTADESTQSFKDSNELKGMWGSNYDKYYNKIKECVDSTKGIYLTYNGSIIDAVYHSTSNGMTEDASNVWSGGEPYLIPVESIYDSSNKSYQKDVFMTYEEVSSKLNMDISSNTEFNVLTRTSGNRVGTIKIDNQEFRGVDIRNRLGLRSADFIIQKVDEGINITTFGYGHGVGLSQYGANGYANHGYNYEQILKHYYTGINFNYKN